jgi:uncharacterized SAM-binding protein YcdF (DUF218 family)
MFFILSKTLDFLLSPPVWVIFILIFAVFTRRKRLKRRLFRMGLGLTLLFSNFFIANGLMLLWEIPPTPLAEIKESYSVGIVLTGITMNQYKAPDDRVYLREGADRIMHALLLYREGKIKKILITGGSIDITGEVHASEAKYLADILRLAQVPEEDIILETKARNTRENAQFSKEILDKKFPNQSYLLITSAFHLRRARACFEKVGLKVTPFSAAFYSYDFKWDASNIIPSARAWYIWAVLIHEVTGYVVYKVVGYA